MEPKSKALNREELIQDYRKKGNVCFNNKNFLEAITYYRKGLELDPNNPHLNNNMAQAYLETRDFKSAEHHAVKAIKFQVSVKGYYRAAKACERQGNREGALEYLNKGIAVCGDSNTEDLRIYLDQMLREDNFSRTEAAVRRSQEDVSETEEAPSLITDSEPDDECVHNDKLRSQSVSRVSTSTSHLDSNKTSTVTQRSVSVSRTSNSDADIKAGKTPKKKSKKKDNIEKDPILTALASIKKDKGIHDITTEKRWSVQRYELQSLMKEGSELMARGLSRRAVEKYKTALDMILSHSVENSVLKEMEVVVLKYALCVGWIDLASYGEIVKAVEHLKDIEATRASKFPAVFYGLGSAYYKLNRYKIATEHLEKGLLFLKREVKFEVHSWPGTDDIIPETTRNGLQDVLKELLKTCRAYHEPDAICRYSKCLSISSHLIPSEHIFYSDPDFCGFVVVYCQEKCRIEYHLGCWKDYKEAVMSNEIGKFSEKDFIGRSCPTTDCVTQTNERSVITKIEIVGDDTTVKASIEAPKSDTTTKESKKTKKKKGEKNAEAAVQDKPKSKLQPKTKKSIAEMIQTASQEMPASSSSEELVSRLDKLKVLRDVNFGYTHDNHWNPKENYFGREDVRRLDHFSGPEVMEESEERGAKKEFVFSYFYEFIRNEGPQKMKDLEQKWQIERDDLEGVSDCINPHTNICSFLRQSYRFVSVDDYVCLAEQLAETYKKAKTELVQSLSFTLMGVANYTKKMPDMSEHPIISGYHTDPALKLRLLANLNTHNFVGKPPVETMFRSFVDTPPGSTKIDEVFIPDAEVGDPDIHTGEDIFAAKRLPATSTESVNEGDSLGIIYRGSYCSDELDNRSDEVHDGDGDGDDDDDDDDDDDEEEEEEEEEEETEENEDEEDEYEDGEQQEKNLMIHVENSAENHEKENINEKEEAKRKQIEEELAKGLNPDANEFKPLEVVVPEHGELKSHSEGNVEAKTAARIVPAPFDNIHLIGTASGVPSLQSAGSKLEKWSSADGQPGVSTPLTHLSSQKTALTLAVELEHPVVYLPPFTSPVEPSQQSKLSNTTTQTNEMQNFEEEVVILKSIVKDLAQQLKDSMIVKEALKKTLESKLEEQDKKIKDLELEMAKVVEKYNKDTKVLKEKLTKKEQECEAEKAMLNEEKKEREKSESHTKEMIRNLISETGQKVKELDEELASSKQNMTNYLFEAKKEAQELKIRHLEQKCKDTLHAMQYKMRHLMDLDIPQKTEVATAIKKWEEFSLSLNEHEVQFQDYCSSLKEKKSITLADLMQKWPVLPESPTCPLDVLEEMSQKALDEREDMKGKLLTRDKAVTEMIDDQWRTRPTMAEQFSKLKKTVENRPEKISSPVIIKEQAQDPSKTLMKLHEVAKKVDPSNSKEEEKIEKKSEQSVGSDMQGLKQNIASNIFTSLPPANAALPISSVPSVPFFQPSTQHYGHHSLLHTSPYFYNVTTMNYPVAPMSYLPMGMEIPAAYGQQQSPPVTSSGSVFQHGVPPASKGSDKASTQQQAEPSSVAAETPRVSISSIEKADKLQSQLESTTVTKKKKSPSPTSGLTPIEYTRNVSAQNGPAVATSQGTADPVVTKTLLVSSSAVGVPKQNLPQLSKPAELQKPLVQTPYSIAAASIVDSRLNIISAPKPKKGGRFQKLMDQLRKNFPSKTEEELSASVASVRERNNNTLTGLPIPTIISKVDKFLKEKANKQGSMGMDKFGNAWCGVRDNASSWSKSNDSAEDDCIICMEPMTNDQTSLQCKHSFHTKCIRQWLQTESICPMCRVFTRMADEFPPLS